MRGAPGHAVRRLPKCRDGGPRPDPIRAAFGEAPSARTLAGGAVVTAAAGAGAVLPVRHVERR